MNDTILPMNSPLTDNRSSNEVKYEMLIYVDKSRNLQCPNFQKDMSSVIHPDVIN